MFKHRRHDTRHFCVTDHPFRDDDIHFLHGEADVFYSAFEQSDLVLKFVGPAQNKTLKSFNKTRNRLGERLHSSSREGSWCFPPKSQTLTYFITGLPALPRSRLSRCGKDFLPGVWVQWDGIVVSYRIGLQRWTLFCSNMFYTSMIDCERNGGEGELSNKRNWMELSPARPKFWIFPKPCQGCIMHVTWKRATEGPTAWGRQFYDHLDRLNDPSRHSGHSGYPSLWIFHYHDT